MSAYGVYQIFEPNTETLKMAAQARVREEVDGEFWF